MPVDSLLALSGTTGWRKYLGNLSRAWRCGFDTATGEFKWKKSDDATVTAVDNTHAQTIAGVKTFTSNPVFSADGYERFAEVTVSSAELLALAATPKTLVAAPGAGKMLVFRQATLIADNGTAYTVTAGGDDLAIRYKDGAGDIVSATADTAGLIDSTSDLTTSIMPLITDNKTTKADAENQPLVLDNIGANEFTTGTGVLRVKIWYMVVTTGW